MIKLNYVYLSKIQLEMEKIYPRPIDFDHLIKELSDEEDID